ncbi:MAG: DUF3604 domain-containing protein, partial [Myxococcales bacterium]|nr:DUF3604 domain-containing protein [Myxococcales bacterium]
SDGHKGRPGAEGPGAGQFGIYGGLTCVLAEALTRPSVFAALRARRCYGTTGARVDLDFTVNGQPMGAAIQAEGEVAVRATVRGAAPIEALELYRGRDRLARARPPAFDRCSDSRRVRLTWGGARIRGRGRRAVWDGVVEVAGARVTRVEPHAFDSPADGVDAWSHDQVTFRSRTTGDLDGLDLWLDQARRGRITLRTGLGELAVDLEALTADGHAREFGGLDLRARITRYPEAPRDLALSLAHTVALAPGEAAALYVKAIQSDGHMAWSSPIYVNGAAASASRDSGRLDG